MEREEMSSSCAVERRLRLPLHLLERVLSATKVTIVSDNAKVPPLPLSSPILREERGLPRYIPPPPPMGGLWRYPTFPPATSNEGGKPRKPESRWESMPKQHDSPSLPGVSRNQLDLPFYDSFHGSIDMHTTPIRWDAPLSPPTPTPLSPGAAAAPSADSPSVDSPSAATIAGLNVPKRRESFDQSDLGLQMAQTSEGISLLSQVLSEFDLYEEYSESESVDAGLEPRNSQRYIPKSAVRPALSPTEKAAAEAPSGLSIPVRRKSIDELDGLLPEDLDEFCSSSDDELDHHLDFSDDDDDYYDEDESESTSGYLYPDACKDDSTIVTASNSSTMTTLSAMRSSATSVIREEKSVERDFLPDS
jgi:hypothetical protein